MSAKRLFQVYYVTENIVTTLSSHLFNTKHTIHSAHRKNPHFIITWFIFTSKLKHKSPEWQTCSQLLLRLKLEVSSILLPLIICEASRDWWEIQLIGCHTCLIDSACQSTNQAVKSNQLCADLWDRIKPGHRSGGRKHFCSTEGPNKHRGLRKKFGTSAWSQRAVLR